VTPLLTDLLHEWRDYFAVIGGAAAALVGAMFVVVSIGIGFFNRGHATAISSFLTQTVIHLSAVIVICAFTMVPTLDWAWFGAGLVLAALVGLVYSGIVARDVARRRELELVDHFWYAAVPLVGYLAVAAAAYMTLEDRPHPIEVLAFAVALLVIGGIRNSWDMIVFLVTQNRKRDDST
jgi:predicted neutral ceramidase superfamily lipid hydrolase